MTYPQPLASQEVIEGQEYFRLFTELQSGGDAYELDVSGKAFVIGPQSDLGAVRVTYFDPGQPSQNSSFVVTVGDPFIGRVDADGTVRFPISNGPGRVIVTPEDLWNRFWLPTSDALDTFAYVKPKIDLISYLAPPSSVPLKRADFVQRGRVWIKANGQQAIVMLPFYRRKYASIQVRNRNAGGAGWSVSMIGVNFTTDAVAPFATPTDWQVLETPIPGGAVPLAGQAVAEFTVKASVHGLFDYLVVSITGDAIDGADADPLRYNIRCTDEEI